MKMSWKCANAIPLLMLSFAVAGCPGKKENEKKVSLPPADQNPPPASAQAAASAAAPVEVATMAPAPREAPANASQRADASLAARVSGSVVAHTQGSTSFKVGGHIEKTYVRVGDTVKKGQVLAELDSSDFQLRERLAAAALQQAKIQYEQAQRDLAREEQLRKENATSQAVIERMNTAFAAAKVGMETAQINLDTARKAVADTKLAAPFGGIVTRKYKSEGEFVGGGAPVFDVADTSDLEISLKVPEGLVRQLRVGRALTVTSPSSDLQLPVKIVRVVPVISETTRTFEIIAAPAKSGAALFPGQYVEADLN